MTIFEVTFGIVTGRLFSGGRSILPIFLVADEASTEFAPAIAAPLADSCPNPIEPINKRDRMIATFLIMITLGLTNVLFTYEFVLKKNERMQCIEYNASAVNKFQ